MARKQTTVTRKSLIAHGENKTEAKQVLETMTDWALETRHLHIECRFGWLIIISAIAQGYETKVLDPATVEHGIKYHAGCFHGQVEFGPLLQSCRTNAAQNAWTFDADDEAHIEYAGLDERHASDLARWIAWQRSYSALKAQGLSDNEAHRQASFAA